MNYETIYESMIVLSKWLADKEKEWSEKNPPNEVRFYLNRYRNVRQNFLKTDGLKDFNDPAKITDFGLLKRVINAYDNKTDLSDGGIPELKDKLIMQKDGVYMYHGESKKTCQTAVSVLTKNRGRMWCIGYPEDHGYRNQFDNYSIHREFNIFLFFNSNVPTTDPYYFFVLMVNRRGLQLTSSNNDGDKEYPTLDRLVGFHPNLNYLFEFRSEIKTKAGQPTKVMKPFTKEIAQATIDSIAQEREFPKVTVVSIVPMTNGRDSVSLSINMDWFDQSNVMVKENEALPEFKKFFDEYRTEKFTSAKWDVDVNDDLLTETINDLVRAHIAQHADGRYVTKNMYGCMLIVDIDAATAAYLDGNVSESFELAMKDFLINFEDEIAEKFQQLRYFITGIQNIDSRVAIGYYEDRFRTDLFQFIVSKTLYRETAITKERFDKYNKKWASAMAEAALYSNYHEIYKNPNDYHDYINTDSSSISDYDIPDWDDTTESGELVGNIFLKKLDEWGHTEVVEEFRRLVKLKDRKAIWKIIDEYEDGDDYEDTLGRIRSDLAQRHGEILNERHVAAIIKEANDINEFAMTFRDYGEDWEGVFESITKDARVIKNMVLHVSQREVEEALSEYTFQYFDINNYNPNEFLSDLMESSYDIYDITPIKGPIRYDDSIYGKETIEPFLDVLNNL